MRYVHHAASDGALLAVAVAAGMIPSQHRRASTRLAQKHGGRGYCQHNGRTESVCGAAFRLRVEQNTPHANLSMDLNWQQAKCVATVCQ